MKKLILQVYWEDFAKPKYETNDGGYLPDMELSLESEKRFRIYANSIGADYKMLREPHFKNIMNPGWDRFSLFWEEDYDLLCYVDADILPSNQTLGVSIFDWPGVAKKTERDEGSKQEWHVNAGVFKVTKQEAMKLRWQINNKKNLRHLKDFGKNQGPFNDTWYKTFRRRPEFLDPRWNCTRKYHSPRWWAHYIGAQKLPRGNQFGCMAKCPVYNESW